MTFLEKKQHEVRAKTAHKQPLTLKRVGHLLPIPQSQVNKDPLESSKDRRPQGNGELEPVSKIFSRRDGILKILWIPLLTNDP